MADAACYRDGDSVRLLEKARQLEARLPLQDATVQIPYENTLGGFAMFNTGVTDAGRLTDASPIGLAHRAVVLL